ncbi:MAG: hypothetical protein ACKOI2_07065 [Actinomycetota bacterium]
MTRISRSTYRSSISTDAGVVVVVLVDVLVEVLVDDDVLVDDSVDGVGGTDDDVVEATSVVVETSVAVAVESSVVVGTASPMASTGAIVESEAAATASAVIEYGNERLTRGHSYPDSTRSHHRPDGDHTLAMATRMGSIPLLEFSRPFIEDRNRDLA